MTLHQTHHRYAQARRLVSLANASGDRSRIRAKVEQYQAEGYTPPLCPWCAHWGTVGWAWTCNRGMRAGEKRTECEGFDRQLDMFGRTG